MPKGEARRVNQESQNIHQQNAAQNQQLTNFLNQSLIGAQGPSNQLYNQILGGYQNVLNHPSPALGGYNEFARTGGWSPSDRSGMEGDINYLRDWSRNSISPEDQARMRGGGVYDEFSRTGGYSAQDLANIRSRSNAQIPAFYDALRGQIEQQNRIQGTNPGYSAQLAKMARQQAQGQAENAVNTEVGIKGEVNKGRQWGTQGMTDSESRLQDLLSRNLLGGLGLAGNLKTGMMDSVNRGRMFGIGGQAQESNRDLQALGGMQNLYSSTPGQVGMYVNALMQATGMSQQEAQNYINQQMQYNPNRSFWDTLGQVAGIGLPLVSPFMNGGGGRNSSHGVSWGGSSPAGIGYGAY